jgi:hypothetical protein
MRARDVEGWGGHGSRPFKGSVRTGHGDRSTGRWPGRSRLRREEQASALRGTEIAGLPPEIDVQTCDEEFAAVHTSIVEQIPY